MTISIFVVSLNSTSQRSKRLENAMRSAGLRFEFIEAIDGREFDPQLNFHYDAPQARRYMGRDLVGGEIGCYLSHLKAAKRFLEEGSRYGVVLEDDAAPSHDLLNACYDITSTLERIDPEWLLVNIGKSSNKLYTAISKTSNHKHVVQAAHYFPVTTHGLLWSRRGAMKFIREHETIWAPVDNFLRHWLTRDGHGYAVHPPLVAVTGAESMIAPASKGSLRQRNGRTWHFALTKQKRLFIDKLIAARHKANFNRVPQSQGVLPAE